MKTLRIFSVAILGFGLVLQPLLSNIAFAKAAGGEFLVIDNKQILGKVLMNRALLRGKADKNIASLLLRNAKSVNGIGLPAGRAKNSEIAKTYAKQLSSTGASCLKKLRSNVSTMRNGTAVHQCNKNTLLIAGKGKIGEVSGDNGDGEPTAMFLDIIIFIITVGAIGVIMSDENNDEIVPGSLADNILKATGNDVMAGDCGPNQVPGPDGLCGDLR